MTGHTALLQAASRLAHPRAGEPADRDLLAYLAAGGEGALEAILHRHGPTVLRAARRVLPDSNDVDDVFQATFLALTRQVGSIRRGDSLRCWLHGVAHRLALKVRAAARRRRAVEVALPPRPGSDPLAAMSARELLLLVDAEVHRLPQRYRAAVLLCCLEGRTHAEAARELACPLTTLRSQLQRGRALLRSRLARRGVALPAALLGPALATGAVPRTLALATIRAASGQASARVASLALGAASTFPLLRVGALLLLSLTGAALCLQPIAAPPPAPPARVAEAPTRDADGTALPVGAVGRLGTLRFRQGGWLRGLSLSSDGKLLATGGHNTVRLWDAASGKEVRSLPFPGNHEAVALSPDGKRLAVGHQTGAALLDASSGKVLHQFGPGMVKAAAFVQGGKAVVTAGAGGWALWDAATGKALRRHDPGGTNSGEVWVRALAWSPGGLLAWGYGEK